MSKWHYLNILFSKYVNMTYNLSEFINGIIFPLV